MKNQNAVSTQTMPMVALRGLVLFPNTVTSVDIARERSLGAIRRAMEGDGRFFAVAQRDSMVDHPSGTDLYAMGTIAHIKHIVQQPDQSLRVLVEGEKRALLLSVLEDEDSQAAVILPKDEPQEIADTNQKAIMRTIVSFVKSILNKRATPMPELIQAISGEKDPRCFADVVAAGVLTGLAERQQILECSDAEERLNLLLKIVSEELTLTDLEEKVQARAREYMERANHDYFLREQIHAIQDELGEGEDEDIVELRRRLKESKMPDEPRERVEKELRRLSRTAIQAPESSVSQNYIEYMLDLPWGVEDASPIDLKKARRILDEDHYGMKEVKERLIEYLAVRSITDQAKSPILCLVGPPGTGKTLLLYDIAMKLSQKHKVCMIHCGEAGKKWEILHERLRRIDFWSDNQVKNPINLEDYSAILVDEAHLLSAEKLELLLECVKEQPVIFSSDVEDMISSKEIDRRGTRRIEHLPEIQIFRLTNRIRANAEVSSFIQNMMHLPTGKSQKGYPHI